MRILESVFGVGLSGDFPLFPNEKGEFVAKDLVVKSFKAVASGLNLPVHTPEGYELWGGHSLRVTGARWLASRGVALLTIQVLARWSSDVVLRYVAETPLQSLTAVPQFGVDAISQGPAA